MTRAFGLFCAGICATATLSAEILMYEGFPTGAGGYAAASGNLAGQTVSSSAVYGFSEAKFAGGTYVYSFGTDSGLSFPANFPASYQIGGDGASGFAATQSWATQYARDAYKKVQAGILDRTSGKLYFRFLLQADAKALSVLDAAGGELQKYNYYAGALVYANVLSTEGILGLALSGTRTRILGVGVGFTKDASGVCHISLITRGLDDAKNVYPIVDNPVAGQTYIALVEIDINAGTDGREKLRASVQDAAAYDAQFVFPALSGDSDTVEVEVMDGTASASLAYLAVTGKMYAGGGTVKFDEFALATEADDLVYIKSGTDSYSLYVASNIEGVGSPTPAYGKVENAATDGSLVATPGGTFFKDGIAYECTGYAYETRDADGVWSLPVAHDATSFTMNADANAVRITWQWVPVACRLAVTTYGSGSETYSFSPAATYPLQADDAGQGGYFTTNASVTVTAQGAAGSTFTSWSGDIGSASASSAAIAIAADAPRNIAARFATTWVYDSSEKTATDGNWVVRIGTLDGTYGGVRNPQTIRECSAGGGILDLAKLDADLAAAGEAPVAAIDAGAFAARTDLVELVLASEITYIGSDAFRDCSALSVLPDFSHLVTIGARAFSGCAGMSGTPDFSSLVTAENSCFYNCTGLTGNLSLPALTTAKSQCFGKCGFDGVLSAPELTFTEYQSFLYLNITSAYCPKLEVVGGSAFWGCAKMTALTLAPTWREVSTAGLIGCSALVTISPAPFPDSFTNAIGRIGFQNASLEGLVATLPADFGGFATNSNNESYAFDGTKIKSLDFSATKLVSVPLGTFRDCSRLENLTFPATVDAIGSMAFGSQKSVDRLLVLDFAGPVPSTVDDLWLDYPDKGSSRPNRDYKVIVRVLERNAASWLADSHFTPLASVEDVAEKPFYDSLSDYRRVVGVWRNAWLCVVPAPGFTLTVR